MQHDLMHAKARLFLPKDPNVVEPKCKKLFSQEDVVAVCPICFELFSVHEKATRLYHEHIAKHNDTELFNHGLLRRKSDVKMTEQYM